MLEKGECMEIYGLLTTAPRSSKVERLIISYLLLLVDVKVNPILRMACHEHTRSRPSADTGELLTSKNRTEHKSDQYLKYRLE